MKLFRQDPDSDQDKGRRRETRRGPRTPTPRRPQTPLPPGRPFRTLAFWVFVGLLALVAYRMYQGNFMATPRVEVSYTRFIQEVESGNVEKVQIIENVVTGELKRPSVLRASGHETQFKAFKTNILGDGSDLPDRIWKTNPGIEIEVRNAGFNWLSFLFTSLPFLLLLPLWLLLIRQMQGSGSAALKFGKTKAKVLIESAPKVTFKDVAGCDEAKQELQEIIEFLKEPQKFQRLGGRIPKGALLLGPPGSGKTLLAKAVAGEAGVPFFSMSGSDFVEMFVGVGASVTGDTPVLIREAGSTRLIPIGEFVDRHYRGDREGFVVPVHGIETLGIDRLIAAGQPTWTRVAAVYRHRANEIYEIEYAGTSLQATADHSLFVHRNGELRAVAARELRVGDRLADLTSSITIGPALEPNPRMRTSRRGATMLEPDTAAWQPPRSASVVRAIRVVPFDGYVYDLCGCENEAFFGGEKPILLHNSRVRDLFEQGKRNAPCVPGHSLITLSDGRQIPIQEMFENAMVGVKVPAMTPDFRLEDATVLGITRKRCTDLYRVTLATTQLEATGNHELPVLRAKGVEWVPVAKLTEGDFVAVPRHIRTSNEAPLMHELLPEETRVRFRGDWSSRGVPISEIVSNWDRIHSDIGEYSVSGFGRSSLGDMPVRLNEELAYLHGLLCSDGCFGKPGSRTVVFTNTNVHLHEEVSGILRENFGYTPKRHLANSQLLDGTGRVQPCYNTHINSRLIREILLAITPRILSLPESFVGAWLRGMFDGDGCVRNDSSAPQVVISAWNPEVNRLVRDALLRVGIPTSISPAALSGKDGNIVITGKDPVSAFVGYVGAYHPEKRKDLFSLAVMLAARNTCSSRLDPVPAGGVLNEARKSIGMGQRGFERGNAVSQYEHGKVAPSRATLQYVTYEMERWCEREAVSPTQQLQDLQKLVRSDVLWARVRGVESIPPVEAVYDLCLDKHHSFVVSRCVASNCIIFIDEIDAVGRHRGAGLGGGHDEREQTLNQLLVEMDGFDSNEGVIMIAATNRPDVLDPALMRPGRFDRQIVVDWPDVRGREGIFRVHTRNIPLADDVDLKLLARGTPGMAGADIANLVNEAALLAARRNHKKVTLRDFEDAKDKVMLGMERKSLVMTDEERKTTAYHEAGHALVAWLQPGSDPVDKITIIPRGRALGVTSYLPSEERHARSRDDLIRVISMMMGGRAAEQLVFNHLTTGAANDLERATGLARKMVCELGMSENLGPLTFGKKEEMVFLGREIATHKDYSEHTAVMIDQEVRRIAEDCYQQAFNLLKDNVEKLHLLAGTLLEREVLDGDQMNRLLRGEKLEPARASEPALEPVSTTPEKEAPRKEGDRPLDLGQPSPRPAGA